MGLSKTLECEVALTFRQQNLANPLQSAFSDCNLYIVTRRPRTYVLSNSVRITKDGRLSGKFIVEHHGRRHSRRFKFPFILESNSRLRWVPGLPRDYYQIADEEGNLAFHGDPWGLAFLGAGLPSDLAAHEVLYVGKSTGVKHERNSFDRIAAHETIQRIYADQSGWDYDVFISVLRVRDSSTTAHLSTAADFSMAENITELIIRSASSARSVFVDAVTLCEAALIAYFKPQYNKVHKNRFPDARTEVSRLLTQYRYSNFSIVLDDGGSGIQLWSEARAASRYHFVTYRLAGPPDIPADEFAESAQGMEDSAAQILTDIGQAVRLAAVTLACMRVDEPERVSS